MDVLPSLAKMVAALLGIYLAFKLGDMFIRETFVYLGQLSFASIMFLIELLIGVIIPIRIFISQKALKSPGWLLSGSLLVILGVLLNRINVFLVAYSPPYATQTYYPSIGEISVTIGFIALEVLLYRLFVKIFPVISLPDKSLFPKTKYAIRGEAE
jgi:Ni/Fe-hydrogenase subunit HybB-like protein